MRAFWSVVGRSDIAVKSFKGRAPGLLLLILIATVTLTSRVAVVGIAFFAATIQLDEGPGDCCRVRWQSERCHIADSPALRYQSLAGVYQAFPSMKRASSKERFHEARTQQTANGRQPARAAGLPRMSAKAFSPAASTSGGTSLGASFVVLSASMLDADTKLPGENTRVKTRIGACSERAICGC